MSRMPDHDTTSDELAHLRSLLERGETLAVVQACERRLAIDELDAASWYLLGQAHRYEDDYESAATALRRACALEANPGFVLAHGIALQLDGQLESAVDILEQGTARWDRHHHLHNSLGLTYRKMGRYADARKEYSAAIYWHAYHLIRDKQAWYLRPKAHPPQDGEPLWMRVYMECAVRITTEDGFDAIGAAEDDFDPPEAGLFWADDVEVQDRRRRLWLARGPSALYWLLGADSFYCTCVGNLASVVSLLGDAQLAEAYLREAEHFKQRSTNQ
jgi:tetratricopeptide (TPR) repeat protein